MSKFTEVLMLVVLWAVSGPIFGFSYAWQLVINASTTIVTFLMVSRSRTPRTAPTTRCTPSSTS